MSRRNLLILTTFVLINACSITAPFVDSRREAGTTYSVGRSIPEKPAICYNALTTPYKDVLKLATEECRRNKNGNYAVPEEQTTFTCRLFAPNHFYFSCVK